MAVRQTLSATRETPRWIERTLFWVAVTAGVVVAIVLAAALLFSHRATLQPQQAVWGPSDPPRMVLCRSGPSASCARAAASRIGVPAAWIVPPAGYTFGLFVAVPARSKRLADRAFVYERLLSAHAVLEIATRSRPMVDSGSNASVAHVRTRHGLDVRIVQGADVSRTLTLSWNRRGVSYQLAVARTGALAGTIPSTDALLEIVDAIRYEAPRGA